MPNLLWILPALALLPCGWFAGAWYYKRRIHALQAQLNAARQTAAENANQARRQIGQLQTELAARPPLPATVREERAIAAAQAAARPAAAEREAPAHGFAATALLPHGFAETQVMK
jgi:hypothetical protein